ncbi:MAG: hypothetical protein HZC41_13640 [Chloroflexi bacterium]|nr:hypothetical protein [Chloroflexota bacterium]
MADPAAVVGARHVKRFPLPVWLFALALAILTSLPYLVGWWSTPAGWQYSGAAAVPVGAQVDFNSHLAKMWQGSRGQWDYHLLFTHEPHPGLPLVQGFYVALGALAQVTLLSLPAAYHIARFILTIGLVLALWAFASHFLEKRSERWLALLFGTIASGWSWLLLALDPAMTAQLSPIEFWLTDAFNLLGAFVMPHFAAVVIVQIVIVLAFEGWVRTPPPDSLSIHGQGGQVGTRYIVSLPVIVLTLALAAQAIIQPYAALLFGPLLVILAGYHVFSTQKLSLRRALWLLLPLNIYAALMLYQYVALHSHPVWSSFAEQNQTLSPLVTYYLLGYLPFILPMAFGLRTFLMDRPDDRWWMPILWVALVAMLLYAPFPTQRRYLLGVQTPLAMLAAYGWSRAVLPCLSRRLRPLASIVYFGLASVGLMAVIAVNAVALSQPERHTDVFYQPDEARAFDWLRQETNDRNALVLTVADESGRGSGGRLVAALGLRVYLGHWIETADFADKVANVRHFYDQATTDEWRKTFLKDTGVAYIWYDEYARAVGDWNPAGADYLEPVFTSEKVTIYRVSGL